MGFLASKNGKELYIETVITTDGIDYLLRGRAKQTPSDDDLFLPEEFAFFDSEINYNVYNSQQPNIGFDNPSTTNDDDYSTITNIILLEPLRTQNAAAQSSSLFGEREYIKNIVNTSTTLDSTGLVDGSNIPVANELPNSAANPPATQIKNIQKFASPITTKSIKESQDNFIDVAFDGHYENPSKLIDVVEFDYVNDGSKILATVTPVALFMNKIDNTIIEPSIDGMILYITDTLARTISIQITSGDTYNLTVNDFYKKLAEQTRVVGTLKRLHDKFQLKVIIKSKMFGDHYLPTIIRTLHNITEPEEYLVKNTETVMDNDNVVAGEEFMNVEPSGLPKPLLDNLRSKNSVAPIISENRKVIYMQHRTIVKSNQTDKINSNVLNTNDRDLQGYILKHYGGEIDVLTSPIKLNFNIPFITKMDLQLQSWVKKHFRIPLIRFEINGTDTLPDQQQYSLPLSNINLVTSLYFKWILCTI
jgi:hypothetical protein